MPIRKTGGRIPNQNRPVQAPGVGRNSKRHDLERQNVPPLHGSDLQQGDVQALEQGQRIQPLKRMQPPGLPERQPPHSSGLATSPEGQPEIPTDPIEFLGSRLGGTYSPGGTGIVGPSRHQYRSWLPLLERIATAPGASGTLVSAFITRLHNMLQAPTVHTNIMIDQQDLDADLEAFLEEQRGR